MKQLLGFKIKLGDIMSNYKTKLLDTIDSVLDEIDAMEDIEKKAQAASWFSEFALEAAASVVGYSRLHPDMRQEVRKGIRAKHQTIRNFIKG